MSISLSVPAEDTHRELKPRIMVVGVGGAGGNAVNDMIAANLDGVEFLAVNTDAQALQGSNAPRKVQMGAGITHGLGAGARPEVGSAAAEESLSEIMEHLEGSNMVFIAAGMGGGTGTGGAPVIAKAARELGILTVGVVTKPFQFEGVHRMRLAEKGIEDLEGYVDTLIVIPNQNLFRIANEKTTFADAFRLADEVLYSGVRGVTDLMIMPGMINLDFADIRSVMSEMGKAMMGTGEAEGERRALDAAEAAIANPLLDDTSMKGAKGVLINITGGDDMTLFEVDEAANRIRSEVDEEAYIIFGSAFDGELEGRVRVSVVATGIDADSIKRPVPMVLSAMDHRHAPVMAPPEAVAATEDVAVKKDDEPLIPLRFAPQTSSENSAASRVEVARETASEDKPLEAPGEVVTDTESPPDAIIENEPLSLGPENLEIENQVAEAAIEQLEAEEEPPAPVAEESVETVEELATDEGATETDFQQTTVEQEQQAPAAMPSVDADESFIPPVPTGSDGKEPEVPTDPFAISDMMNDSRQQPSTVASKPSKPRGESLFDRIMGGGKSQVSNVQPLDWKTTASGKTVAGSEDGLVNRPPNPAQEPAVAKSPASLGGAQQVERLPSSDHEEDLLDIPAFLRRQAN